MSFVRVVFADRHRTTPRTLTIVAPAPMLSGALRKPIIQYRKAHPNVKLTLIDRPSNAARKVIENDEADIIAFGALSIPPHLPEDASSRHLPPHHAGRSRQTAARAQCRRLQLTSANPPHL
jgi:DNA-binding transcriptional LysR family regulator